MASTFCYFLLAIAVSAASAGIVKRNAMAGFQPEGASIESLDNFINKALDLYVNEAESKPAAAGGDDKSAVIDVNENASADNEVSAAAAAAGGENDGSKRYICVLVRCIMPYETCLSKAFASKHPNISADEAEVRRRQMASSCYNVMQACSALCD